MAETKIVVGPQPFSVGEEYPWLAERDEDGAVVTLPVRCATITWLTASKHNPRTLSGNDRKSTGRNR